MSRDWRTILAIDSDRWAVETYAANFPDTQVLRASVADRINSLPQADVVIAGPPCQPFSDAGDNKGESDERDCIPDFIAAAANVWPRQFLMENVRGLLKAKHWRYFCRAIDGLEALGYAVQWKLLNAVSFGVPQFRERVWVWGIRSDLAAAGVRHCWPKPTHAWPPPEPCMFGAALLPDVTVCQALGLDGWYGAQNETAHGPNEPCGTIQGNAQAKGGGAGHYAIHRHRGKGFGERRGFGLEEPSQTVNGGNGDGGSTGALYLQSHADPPRSINVPATTLRSGGKGHDGCCVRIIGAGRHDITPKTVRDITDEPSQTIVGQWQGHQQPEVVYYRWSEAMRQKHPPASPASPAPTVQAKWHKGGAEGLLEVDTKQRRTHRSVTEPAPGVANDSRHHLRNQGRYIRRLTPDECGRLQSVPDDFRWPDKITKTARYRLIGNGWASLMAWHMSQALKAADPASETAIDLFCGAGLGAAGWHGRFWSYSPLPASEGVSP